jgi:ssDNA-binding Zn-finger/Zn-ribbon topoisomerase 1
MAQCKMCGQKGFLLKVSANGLCKSCDPIVVMDVQQRGRIINDCMKLIDESKNIKTRLSRCDLLIEHAQALLEYEHKGIPTVNPSPSHLLSEYMPIRTQMAGGENSDKLLIQKHKEIQSVTCPYCNAQLDSMPTRKKKCPSCNNWIFTRIRPSDRQRILVTESGAKVIDQEIQAIRAQKAKAIQEEIAANNKATLKQYKQEGLKKVEIFPALDDNTCSICKAAAGVYPIGKVPLLPIANCTNPNGCRCTYLPVVE